MKDLYSLLNVTKECDKVEIKKSYKKLAFEYHPDKNKDPTASDKFKEISEAYEILTNKDKYIQNPQFRQNNMPQINPYDLFQQMFSNMNMRENMPFTHPVFMSQGINVVQMPQNTVMRSTSTRIVNGKKIVTITERINGQTRVQTISSDSNVPNIIKIMQNININH